MDEPDTTLPLTAVKPVFVVRLWWEPGGEAGDAPGEWRGSVELLASGQRHFFRRLEDVGDIIARQLPTTGPPDLTVA